jgi:hypothetical protein
MRNILIFKLLQKVIEHLVLCIDVTICEFHKNLFLNHLFPFGKAGELQILRCQGFAVDYYSFTLYALALEPSSFCNVGVNASGSLFGGCSEEYLK